MVEKIFVNLPVRGPKKSIDLFRKLGFIFKPQFIDEIPAGIIVSEDIYVMVLTKNEFKTFTPKPIADATKNTEVRVCFSAATRDKVNEMVRKAVAAGGTTYKEPQEVGLHVRARIPGSGLAHLRVGPYGAECN